MPRIGFSLTEAAMDELLEQLRQSEIPYEGPVDIPAGSAARPHHPRARRR